MNAIEVKALSKKFNGLTAVDHLNLEIREGEVFGLLGPNGAGKTTTISMLSTILAPTSGSASVWGHNILNERDSVRKSIGIVFQDPSLDDELTGKENLDLHGRLYGMETALREERIAEVLELVELKERANDLVKAYSGGMKRRLEIARGLMHKPKILFLDEPTLGLDPQTRRRLWAYIKGFNRKEKVTIILTTHYMEEADFLCSRIAIIDHGRIIAIGAPEELKEVLGGDMITLKVSGLAKLKGLLEKEQCVKEVKVIGKKLSLVVKNGSRAIPKIIACASKNSISVEEVALKQPSLEDVFIHYTGRSIRAENSDSREGMRLMLRAAKG